MTPLRQRMTEDMQLAGYSARTQEAYVGAVGQLFAHFKCTPAQLTEEQLREYFLYLANERKVSRPTATIALCGIKFFYQRTLQRDWTTLGLVRPRPEKKLPVVLSREEVHRILEQVHTPVYRACLKTIGREPAHHSGKPRAWQCADNSNLHAPDRRSASSHDGPAQ